MVWSEQSEWCRLYGADLVPEPEWQAPNFQPHASKMAKSRPIPCVFLCCVCIIFEHTMPISRTLLSTLTKPPTTPLQTRLESSSVLTAFERTSWIWYCARERGPFYVWFGWWIVIEHERWWWFCLCVVYEVCMCLTSKDCWLLIILCRFQRMYLKCGDRILHFYIDIGSIYVSDFITRDVCIVCIRLHISQ